MLCRVGIYILLDNVTKSVNSDKNYGSAGNVGNDGTNGNAGSVMASVGNSEGGM
jgi:hypothetical protein